MSDTPVECINPDGHARIVLACEHASPTIPPEFNDLGIYDGDLLSHAVWDPGAMAIASRLSDWLDAKLVASRVSRLVYDCNRPPGDPSATRDQSERIAVPGNANLSEAEHAHRVNTYYEPFRQALARAISDTVDPILVTIHSFTPIFNGAPRGTEIGILHDTDSRLADIMLRMAPAHTSLRAERNEPYSAKDGVTHTLREHGLRNGIPNVMLEIRNDLIDDETDQTRTARMLCMWLQEACRALAPTELRA